MVRHGKQEAPHASDPLDEMDREAVSPMPILVLDKRDTRPKADRRNVLDNLLGAEPHHNDELIDADRHKIADDLGQDCALAEGQQRLRHLVGAGPKAAPSPSSNDDGFHLCISPESQRGDNGRSRSSGLRTTRWYRCPASQRSWITFHTFPTSCGLLCRLAPLSPVACTGDGHAGSAW